ncbi:MAG: hypothetical protein NC132_00640 [Corallococcus sp.]|nr:hypothetical protein [Corallococcus sp.]
MNHDCSKEFDLNLIYKKLTSKRHYTPTVKACDFFTRKTELQLLQDKMEKIMQSPQKQIQQTR